MSDLPPASASYTPQTGAAPVQPPVVPQPPVPPALPPIILPPPGYAAAVVQRAPWWMLPGLAVLILIIFAGALTASCFMGNSTLQTQMFTAAVSLVMLAVGFFFGSSAGSQQKDDTRAVEATNTAVALSAPRQGDRA